MFSLHLRKNYNPESVQDNYTKFSRLLTSAMVDEWLYRFCSFTHSVLYEAKVKFVPLNLPNVLHFHLKYVHTNKITHIYTVFTRVILAHIFRIFAIEKWCA
jgi:hypothetical protein